MMVSISLPMSRLITTESTKGKPSGNAWLTLVLLRWRHAALRGVSAVLVLAFVFGLGGSRIIPAIRDPLRYVDVHDGLEYTKSDPAGRPIAPGALDAGRWLRAHSDVDDLVATNVHCRKEYKGKCDHRHFWMSAYSERRFLVESWGYTATANQGIPTFNDTWYYYPYWNSSLLADNDRLFSNPTKANADILKEKYGVRWLFVDGRFHRPGLHPRQGGQRALPIRRQHHLRTSLSGRRPTRARSESAMVSPSLAGATTPRSAGTRRPSRRVPRRSPPRLVPEPADLADVDGVAAIVARAVLDVLDPGPSPRRRPRAAARSAPGWSARRRRRCCRPRRPAPFSSTELDAPAVVVDVQPVADVPAVAVERHLLAVDQVGDEQRDDLLRVLVRAVVVGAAGDPDVQSVGAVVGPAEQVSRPPSPPSTASWAAAG